MAMSSGSAEINSINAAGEASIVIVAGAETADPELVHCKI